MSRPVLTFTPGEARILARCSLHYYFQQQSPLPPDPATAELDRLVREVIQELHAAGGPARLSLERCLVKVQSQPTAQAMIERYYRRLEQDWLRLIAGNEELELKITLAGVPVTLTGTVDRLDKTSDGGILAILFRTSPDPPPSPEELRQDDACTIYHALVAAHYPAKRPVRLQEWWLQANQQITIELSEEEYRANLGRLREPIQALARGQVRAQPGLHCESCPFKYQGCPVYSHEQNPSSDLAASSPTGKMSSRTWVFKI
jgi:RecB family exonuclease